jgi:NTE family protein
MNDRELSAIIKQSDLFSDFTPEDILLIQPYFEKVAKKKEEILIHQGDSSDSFFVLLNGKLVSFFRKENGEEKVIGVINSGETIGELGVISGEPRSLTVKALTDAELLKLSGEIFLKICIDNPDLTVKIMKIITRRAQRTIRLISQNDKKRLIIFFSANEEILVEPFKEVIRLQLLGKAFLFLDEEGLSTEKIVQVVQNSATENKDVVIFIKKMNLDVFQHIADHILSFYLIIQDSQTAELTTDVKNILNHLQTNKIKQELIVLHEEQKSYLNTNSWLSVTDFYFYHHVNATDKNSISRFMRFMMGNPIALVLGGGCAKGFCHFGVIKALLENNLPIDIIGGTSTGSIVGGCYVSALNYDKALNIFLRGFELTPATVSFRNITWPFVSIFSGDPLTTFGQGLFGEKKIEDLLLPFLCVSSNISTKTEHIHRKGILWEAIRASSAIPVFWPPMVMNGQLHYDGSILNQLPVDVIRNLLGPRAIIIASELSVAEEDPVFYNFPPAFNLKNAFLYKLGIKREHYQFPQFMEAFFRALFLGASYGARKNGALADILIKPNLREFGLFKLSPEQVQQLIDIGYREMQEAIKKTNIFDGIRAC